MIDEVTRNHMLSIGKPVVSVIAWQQPTHIVRIGTDQESNGGGMRMQEFVYCICVWLLYFGCQLLSLTLWTPPYVHHLPTQFLPKPDWNQQSNHLSTRHGTSYKHATSASPITDQATAHPAWIDHNGTPGLQLYCNNTPGRHYWICTKLPLSWCFRALYSHGHNMFFTLKEVCVPSFNSPLIITCDTSMWRGFKWIIAWRCTWYQSSMTSWVFLWMFWST